MKDSPKTTRRVAVLGSTGSIGTNTLDVVNRMPERFEVVSMNAGRNIDLLCDQVERFCPRRVCVGEDATDLDRLRRLGVEVVRGAEGLDELATDPDVDLVVNGLAASLGLRPTIAAIQCGKDVAIANKETLVVAGHLVTDLARENGVQLIPLDSELTPLWISLQDVDPEEVQRVVLPASGGPFFDVPLEAMGNVTVEEALNHPTWKMGPKITIDSATLMNKGFEVIEAQWFLGVPASRIEVVIHRQSIVHCLIEFTDGSMTAHLSRPDMRLPIQQALTHPERLPSPVAPLDLVSMSSLTFDSPDLSRFPCLGLCYDAIRAGGTAPAVLNAANEVGVYSFLDSRIGFLDVPGIVREALDTHENGAGSELEDLFEADRWGKEKARALVRRLQR